MNVALLFGAVPPGAPPDEADVLTQLEAAEGALRSLGHETARVPLSLDLGRAARALASFLPRVVVNLVESVEGRGSLSHLGPLLLDALRFPYTGAGREALFLTTNKVLTKRWLLAGGFPTPPWATAEDLRAGVPPPSPAIVKPVDEDASIGVDESSLIFDPRRVSEELRVRSARLGTECFAESYVEGREFNISLLEADDGTEVLPPAEIQFIDYPAEKARMVCYRAKWEADSFEFHHTPRRFDFPASDGHLLQRLGEVARGCWRHFGLAGYARLDFRVDAEGEPWVLEINANPCISPDAGFMAAARRRELDYPEVLGRLLEGALRRGRP